jgi:hypothetical protein
MSSTHCLVPGALSMRREKTRNLNRRSVVRLHMAV